MIIVKSTETLKELETQWASAKDAKDGWYEHQLLIEGRVLEVLPQETYLPDGLPDNATLRLDATDIKFADRRTFNQGKLAAVIAEYPWLLKTLFRVEYKCTSNPRLNQFLTGDDNPELAARLLQCFEDKPSKPSFSKR